MTTHFSSAMKDYMDVLEFTADSVDQQLFEYLGSLGHDGKDLPYRMYQCLLGKGVTAGSLQGMLREYITSLGYDTGDLYYDFMEAVIANAFCQEGLVEPVE